MRLNELALADSPWLFRRTDGVLRQPLPAASTLHTCVTMRAKEHVCQGAPAG